MGNRLLALGASIGIAFVVAVIAFAIMSFASRCAALLALDASPRRPRKKRGATLERARAIMGARYFGPSDTRLWLHPNHEDGDVFSAMGEVPWSEETLKRCRKTHMLFAVPAMSIVDIRRGVARSLFSYTHGDDCDGMWYEHEPFALDKGVAGWHLVRSAPIRDSEFKKWSSQLALLKDDEVPVSARVMVYVIIAHYLRTRHADGARLFKDDYVRCADTDSRGVHVAVGCFGEKTGLGVSRLMVASGDPNESRLMIASITAEQLPDLRFA